MYKLIVRVLLLIPVLLGLGTAGNAQSFVLDLPRPSQHAVVTQRIGITDVTINYHRPMVNKRKVWGGGLVPYGQVWRAGANENTTIRFSDPVTIEGKPLAAGAYGLHMIPGENEWVVIFSKNSTSWGSFTYNQAEDALRVTVKPQPAEFHEALAYDFDDVTPDSSIVALRWEKVAVPFKIGVNTHEIVAQNLHNQLRGLAQYAWDGWDDAANYLLQEKINLEEALTYSDKSIQAEARYDNFMTKSKVLDALGRKEEAQQRTQQSVGHGQCGANAYLCTAVAERRQAGRGFRHLQGKCQEEPRSVGGPCRLVAHVFRTRRLRQRRKGNDHCDCGSPGRTETAVAGDGQTAGSERGHQQVELAGSQHRGRFQFWERSFFARY